MIRTVSADSCGPEARCKDVSDEKCLLIAHTVGDSIQTLICMRYADILCLTSVDAAAERPSTVWIGAVVHVSVPAEETFSAESFHIYGDSVARPYVMDVRADFLDNADHLVTDSDARYGARYASMLDVQVTGADAAECDPDYGIL